MRERIRELLGRPIQTEDAVFGRVTDLLFDDRTWRLVHLVVDPGESDPVALPGSFLGEPIVGGGRFRIEARRSDVEAQPSAEEKPPLSRQFVALDLYHWRRYPWSDILSLHRHDADEVVQAAAKGAEDPDRLHLRSAQELLGYRVHARDGKVGSVEDLLLETGDRRIRHLLVDVGREAPVEIDARGVRELDWRARAVEVDLERREVEAAPVYEGDEEDAG